MAPGNSVQKRKKELQWRREKQAADARTNEATSHTQSPPLSAAAIDTQMPLSPPSLVEIGPSGSGTTVPGTAATRFTPTCEDNGPPKSIRCRSGPKAQTVVDWATGKKVKGPNQEKRGTVTGGKTAWMKMMNGGQNLKVPYSKVHAGPVTRQWRSLLSRDIGAAVRSKVPMLAPSYGQLPEEYRDIVSSYLEMWYDIPPTDQGMWEYIDKITINIYKDRKHDCHSHYLEVSKETPEKFIHRPEQWEWLKGHFEDPTYKAICARNTANRNNAKEKGKAINRHSSTVPYSYRVEENAQKGHLAPHLQTFCDVYGVSPNASDRVTNVKRKMDELMARQTSVEAGGSQVALEEEIEVIEQEVGMRSSTKIRGLGGAVTRPAKTRGGVCVPGNNPEVEELKRQLQAVTERSERSEMQLQAVSSRADAADARNEEMVRRMAQLEAALNNMIAGQSNLIDNASRGLTPAAVQSSCAEVPDQDN